MMDDSLWCWRTAEEKTYLCCTLLANWSHGFFSREFYPQLPSILSKYLQPQATAYRVKQVHGDQVLTPSEIAQYSSDLDGQSPSADGVITDAPGQGAWVAGADCTPVLVADARTGQVAAVHAGWRGTAARIVPKTIDRFQAFGSQLGDLRIVLGPAIAGEVYQFDPPVALTVGQSLLKIQQISDPDAQWQALQGLSQSPIQSDPEPHKCRLDVRQIIALQLREIGITEPQLAIAPFCTFQLPDKFFSYRRTHTKEVQWSGIISHHGEQDQRH